MTDNPTDKTPDPGSDSSLADASLNSPTPPATEQAEALAGVPAEVPAATEPAPAPVPQPGRNRTIAGTTWVALIVGALLLILLLVFILQNQQTVELTLLAWTFSFPAGVGYLLSAIAGALIMALVGGVRILELRRQARRERRRS